jgi:hypothetical protein
MKLTSNQMSTAIAIANIFCWNLLPPDKSLVLVYLYWAGISTYVWPLLFLVIYRVLTLLAVHYPSLISRLVLNLRFISRYNSLIEKETRAGVTFNLPSSYNPTMEIELPSTIVTRTHEDMDDNDLRHSDHVV